MIFVQTNRAVAVERAARRDAALFGGAEEVRRIYASRYHPACDLYLGVSDPMDRAGIVIDNDDLERPALRRIYAAR